MIHWNRNNILIFQYIEASLAYAVDMINVRPSLLFVRSNRRCAKDNFNIFYNVDARRLKIEDVVKC